MKSKSTFFAGVLAASLAVPAFANDTPEATPLPQFTAADTQMLFEQDAMPMQLAVLSQQEMKETEGAFAPMVYGALVAANYAWTAFRVSGVVAGAYRVIGPAYNGGRVLQVMHNNNPIFRLDNHRNPYTSNFHVHLAPNMNLHRPWYAPWRGN